MALKVAGIILLKYGNIIFMFISCPLNVLKTKCKNKYLNIFVARQQATNHALRTSCLTTESIVKRCDSTWILQDSIKFVSLNITVVQKSSV